MKIWLFLLVAAPLAAQAPSALLDSARTRLAVLDGTVVVAGLDSAVEVRRDQWGVPHIYARTQHDLFFAQGFVAAQDRLWQMEMWRRAGEGRLAEALGPAYVERDRIARALRFRGDWRAEYASYAPDGRAIMEAFVQGVNASIADVTRRGALPIEFSLLGITPTPWTPDVPLQRLAAFSMARNATAEVTRARRLALLGKTLTEQLWPLDPEHALDPVPGFDYAGIDERAVAAMIETAGPITYTAVQGSNNWVVSGAKTATGKPILANDPHRAIQNPSLRYLTHLVGPGWNVIGSGEPGLPGVAIGHNDRVAFGITIVGMDQQDLYVETVGPCPAGSGRCYLNNGRWKPLRREIDTVRVKGAAPRVLVTEFSEHGPIVGEDTVRHRAFALKFVGAEPGTAGYAASLSLDRAQDWVSFKRAAARFKLPTENLVYADVDGNIGWVAAGLMPVRHWTGTLPVPGTGAYEWSGFLPFDSLPMAYNPPSGFIATANDNILPSGYTKPLNYEFSAPFRGNRLREVLARENGLTVERFQTLQHDDYSMPAAQLLPLLQDAAARLGASARPSVQRLVQWDRRLSRDAEQVVWFHAWVDALGDRVFAPRIPAALRSTIGSRWSLPALIAAVQRPDAAFGDSPSASRDTLLLAALDDAERAVIKRYGADSTGWRWGLRHTASFPHPVSRAFDLPAVSRAGDANTVNAAGGAGDRQTAGASYREIIDLADWDRSVATSTPGQSGQPGSPHYGDLLPLWGDDKYFPLVFSRKAVEAATRHTLVLTPGPQRP
ncbi:MAG: penicillin acylase family protein [Gemmatimonadota bacterium]|nr:penicillin acylase family protein [Gemmatimonadota bacterium]